MVKELKLGKSISGAQEIMKSEKHEITFTVTNSEKIASCVYLLFKGTSKRSWEMELKGKNI